MTTPPYAKLSRMNRMLRLLGVVVLGGLMPAAATAQTFETVGTRAAGMGGAFVAVADDASAVYWNPAGLASAAYLSPTRYRATARPAAVPAPF